MKYVIPFFVMLFVLTSCQMNKHHKADSFYISFATKTKLIPLNEFKDSVTLVQILTSDYKNNSQTINSIVKISPNEMTIIGLADVTRIFTINYQNGIIDAEFSPLIPVKHIEPEYIISDIQLIYYPLNSIKSHLPKNMTIKEIQDKKSVKRQIYRGDEKIIVIYYSQDNFIKADIKFENIERSYSYKITNVEK